MIPEHIKIVNTRWFNGVDCVGFVNCFDSITKQNKVYVGVGHGVSEGRDSIHIAEFGTKVPKAVAEGVFGELENYAW